MRGREVLRSIALALAYHVLHLAVLLAGAGGDATVFLCVGEAAPLPEGRAGRTVRFEGQPGYDGQFTGLVALDPLDRRGTSRYLDDPGKRFSRILLPGTARLTGASDLRGAAWRLAGTNALAAAAVAAAVCALSPPGAGRVAAAVAAAVQPGLAVAVSRCTPGPLGLALALGAFLLLRAGRRVPGGALLALASLDQEIFAAIPVALAVDGLRRRKAAGLLWLLALAPASAWRLHLALRGLGGAIPVGDLGLPAVGLLAGIAPGPGTFLPEVLYEKAHALAFAIVPFSLLRRGLAIPAAALIGVWVAAACADRDVWIAFWSAARATAPAFALAAARGDPFGRIAALGTASFSPLLPVWFALYPPVLVET